jgi:hypothetical protein
MTGMDVRTAVRYGVNLRDASLQRKLLNFAAKIAQMISRINISRWLI